MPLSPRRHGDDVDDDDDGDLNRTLGVQRFQQILSPAPRLPAEQHRTFNQEDVEGKIIEMYIKKKKGLMFLNH